jgi:hypothetical protein
VNAWARAAVLWTPCGMATGAAVTLWLLGYRRPALWLLTALLGGIAGVYLERVARGRHDLRWLARHVVVPAVLTALALDETEAGDGD